MLIISFKIKELKWQNFKVKKIFHSDYFMEEFYILDC